MNTQYKKGVLELCVLSLLHKRDCYAYEISDFLSQHIDIADGTVYPILRKLKSDGLLTTYLQEESGGPPRKYYKLTELGRETYQNDRAEYLNFAQSVRNLLEDAYNEEAGIYDAACKCSCRAPHQSAPLRSAASFPHGKPGAPERTAVNPYYPASFECKAFYRRY